MSDDVKRVGSVFELPDESLLCKTRGRQHAWSEPAIQPATGWSPPAEEWRTTCSCGRWRRDVVSIALGALLSRDYGGGVMLDPAADVDQGEARLIWRTRMAEREAAAVRLTSGRRSRKRSA